MQFTILLTLVVFLQPSLSSPEQSCQQHSTWSEKKLEKFRHNLSNLKLIIIDEMSLMDSDKFYKLEYRLRQIFQSDDLFANIALILIGDLLQVSIPKNKLGGVFIHLAD